ncbi:MAG: mannose/fructose/sorbose family PTS transporter subunit IIC [Alicyclobacillus shizuokensis]|nr:mannose/fructose/sorbose family PTS transporter subunit IIC [Alicyclobacillus shizuokensis]
MAVWQVVAVAVIAAVAGMESVLDEWQWHRPLLACTLIGLVLGHVGTGMAVGATLELTALGWMNIGASQSPDTALASVISAVLAIRAGNDVNQAIAIAIPLAVAGNLLTVLVRTLTIYFQHLSDRMSIDNEQTALFRLNFAALSLQALRVAVPSVLFTIFVSPAMMDRLFSFLPKPLTDGFTAASGFIVVVGYAMVIRSLQVDKLMPYFFLGFLAADFSNITLVAMGILAVAVAWLHVRVWARHDAPGADLPAEEESAPASIRRLPSAVLWRVFWRSQFLQASWNYERMQGMGYAYIVEPTLNFFFPEPEVRLARKLRHVEFFNTQPYVANIVVGINLALEERLQTGDPRYDRLVTSIKLGMMGPLAGVGDSIFWGTLRPLLASLGATIALTGNILGPILFFVGWNILRLAVRWSLLQYGYQLGVRIVNVIATGVLRQVTEMATIVGLIVMGALVADWASIHFAIHWQVGHGQTMSLTQLLNGLFPKLPELLLVLGVLWLLRKGWSSVWVILLLFSLGIVGVYAHVLAA